jgi:hypothetical protein
MIDSIGGTQPVTFDAPVTASSRGLGSASGASRIAATSKVPSASHSMKQRVATRPHGSRLAWCSTTVVRTMSVGRSGSR